MQEHMKRNNSAFRTVLCWKKDDKISECGLCRENSKDAKIVLDEERLLATGSRSFLQQDDKFSGC